MVRTLFNYSLSQLFDKRVSPIPTSLSQQSKHCLVIVLVIFLKVFSYWHSYFFFDDITPRVISSCEVCSKLINIPEWLTIAAVWTRERTRGEIDFLCFLVVIIHWDDWWRKHFSLHKWHIPVGYRLRDSYKRILIKMLKI